MSVYPSIQPSVDRFVLFNRSEPNLEEQFLMTLGSPLSRNKPPRLVTSTNGFIVPDSWIHSSLTCYFMPIKPFFLAGLLASCAPPPWYTLTFILLAACFPVSCITKKGILQSGTGKGGYALPLGSALDYV